MPELKDEAISSSRDPLLRHRSSSSPRSITPAVSSAAASSPFVTANVGSTDGRVQRRTSKVSSVLMYVSEGGSSLSSCRPWDRSDLLRRLSTFKPENWFGKPKAASSLTCARKGWVNEHVDELYCESCGANLDFVSSATWTSYEAECAGEDFAKRLDEGHKVSCPWIGNCCAESLVQFPPTPPSALIGGYKDRCDGLLQFHSLPIVASSAIEHMRLSRGPEIDRLLAKTHFPRNESGIKLEIFLGTGNTKDDFSLYSRAQKLISLCGWEPRWLPNVQDCEENSAESAKDGYSVRPSKHLIPPRHLNRGKKALSSFSERDFTMNETIATNSKIVSRSPLLDCSLCGATVRISDFLTIMNPIGSVPNRSDVPETSKKLASAWGASATSGINGWIPVDSMEKEQVEDHDEAATDEGKSISNVGVDVNLTVSAGMSSSRVQRNDVSERFLDKRKERDLLLEQPAGSEVGDREASYESLGPSSCKRNLDEAGSTVDGPQLLAQQADSVEGTVIDRDFDDADIGGQYSVGTSKRPRDSLAETHRRPYREESSGVGPSSTHDYDLGMDAYKEEFDLGPELAVGALSTRDSAHVSSVIAMDTVYHDGDDDSESVENFPGDFDDVHMPSTSTIKNADVVETSEVNNSNQAQQSTCLASVRSAWEMCRSSTNEEELLNADAATVHARGGISYGISGGSVGMGASHEAEIRGAGASLYKAESVVGDVEPVGETTDNQGQTGEFAPDPGLMGDFIPEDMDRGDRQVDSLDLISRSVVRADSGSKVVGSAKVDSVESGERTSRMYVSHRGNSLNPSLSCNAILFSEVDASKEEVTQPPKDIGADDAGYAESSYHVSNGAGLPNGGNNYEEVTEFDPIKSHNECCPWVNGNVAAAGCISSDSSSSTGGALALCGWQLTLDALDAFQTQGQVPAQTVESESAASLYKDDNRTPARKLVPRNSFNKNRRRN